MDNSNPAARALWLQLSAKPSDVLTTDAAAVRALLAWNDRGNLAPDEYGTDADCRFNLLLQFARGIDASDGDPTGDTMETLFSRAQDDMDARGYGGPDPDSEGAKEARADMLACLLDPARLDEAADMVDHWRDRCGLPEALADALQECVQTNYAIFNR